MHRTRLRQSIVWGGWSALVLGVGGCLPCGEGDDPVETSMMDTSVVETEAPDTGGTDTGAPDTGMSPNQPPVVTILSPVDGGTVYWDSYDQNLDLWYADVPLSGQAVDPEDGNLGGAQRVWTTDRTDFQDAVLGTGASPTVRMYGDDCFGVSHTVTLTATDSAGRAGSERITFTLFTLC